MNQHHLIIGPDESSCTEEIPAVYVQKLMDIGILELCETVNHVRSDVPACQTLIYRMKGKMQKRYTNTRRCLGCGEDSRLCDCSVDMHGNAVAREGCDRCSCGSKYWENDQCVDCQTPVTDSSVDRT